MSLEALRPIRSAETQVIHRVTVSLLLSALKRCVYSQSEDLGDAPGHKAKTKVLHLDMLSSVLFDLKRFR